MIRLALVIICATIILASPASAGISDLPDDSFLWNGFHSIVAVDSFVVAASDFGLSVLKINATTGFFDPISNLCLNTQPIEVKVGASLALVSSTAGLTYVVDLSDLPQLRLLGELDMGSSAYDLALTGDDLYIACGFQGLRHYRLTDYASPEFIDSSLTGVHCIQVDVLGDDLLVLDDYNAILRFDLTEPDLALPASYLWLPRPAKAFFAIHDTLVIPIADQPFLYRGILSDNENRLFDSTVLEVIPEAVYAIDTFLVAINTDRHLMEIISTQGKGSSLYDIHWNSGLEPTGCTYYDEGVPHLLLTSSDNGLVSFNLKDIWFDRQARDVYNHPGPITALAFQNGRFFTGGVRNPLEAYQVSPEGRATYDATLFGLNSVGTVAPADDAVLAHFPSVGLLKAVRLGTNSIETVSNLSLAGQPIGSIKHYPYAPIDNLSVALAVTYNQVNVISISDDRSMSLRKSASAQGEYIHDAIIVDTFLIVTSVERQCYVYHIHHDLGSTWWYGVDTPGPINHMVVVNDGAADDGSGWYPGTVLGFDGNQMYEISVDSVGLPTFIDRGLLPVDVKATTQGNGKVYTIGNQGIGVIGLVQGTPTMIEHGGFGGHLIAFGESTLATSDGKAIHLYSVPDQSVAEPETDFVVAPVTQHLRQNYPNPFNPVTRIDFELPRSGEVEVSVFNLLGRQVISLLSGRIKAGLHSVEWDGTDGNGRRVASGVYFYRLSTPTVSETRKMLLLK